MLDFFLHFIGYYDSRCQCSNDTYGYADCGEIYAACGCHDGHD